MLKSRHHALEQSVEVPGNAIHHLLEHVIVEIRLLENCDDVSRINRGTMAQQAIELKCEKAVGFRRRGSIAV